MPVLSMNRLSQLEQLEVVVATQDLLLSESVDISKYLEDEGKKTRRFEKPVITEQIRRKERNRIPKKTRTKYGLGCKRVSSLG